jgi:large subunit ribosomal protein L25
MKVIATSRTLQGTGASRRLRISGQTPGIVYGGAGQAAAQPITLDHNALYHALKKEKFHSSVLELEIDGGQPTQVLLRDFQMHAYKQLVLHADFQRIDPNQKIHMKVALHFINAEISPAVKLHGGIVSHVLSDLEISCLPADLPESITVDLATLDAGHAVHINDLKLPNGVAPVAKENKTVVTVSIPVAQVVTEAAPAAAKGKGKGKK